MKWICTNFDSHEPFGIGHELSHTDCFATQQIPLPVEELRAWRAYPFVDCAIAAHAKCIVTNDHHYDVLKMIPFPKVEVVSLMAFVEKLSQDSDVSH